MPIPDTLTRIKSFETHGFNTRPNIRYPKQGTRARELLERMEAGPVDLALYEDYVAWRKAIRKLIAGGFAIEIDVEGEGPMLASLVSDYCWFVVALIGAETEMIRGEAEEVENGDMH